MNRLNLFYFERSSHLIPFTASIVVADIRLRTAQSDELYDGDNFRKLCVISQSQLAFGIRRRNFNVNHSSIACFAKISALI